MTIKGLNAFLNKNHKDLRRPIPITAFRGKRVAIDAHYLAFVMMAVAKKRVVVSTDVATTEIDEHRVRALWLKSILDWTCRNFLVYQVCPVFCFDGEHPQEKMAVQIDRREKSAQISQRIEELQRAEKDILSVEEPEELRKLLARDVHVRREDTQVLLAALRSMGLPYLVARGEGEKLGALLVRAGKAIALYSSDSDSLAFGTHIQLKEFQGMAATGMLHQPYAPALMTMELSELLSVLGLSYLQFVDFCILCGCDYNEKVPMIGPIKALKIIRQYGSLDNCPDEVLKNKREGLLIERCRELFRGMNWQSFVEERRSIDVNPEELQAGRERLEELGVAYDDFYERYRDAYSRMGKIEDEPRRPIGPPVQLRLE